MLDLCLDTGEPLPDGIKADLCHISPTADDSKAFFSILDATKALSQLLKGQWYDLHIESF